MASDWLPRHVRSHPADPGGVTGAPGWGAPADPQICSDGSMGCSVAGRSGSATRVTMVSPQRRPCSYGKRSTLVSQMLRILARWVSSTPTRDILVGMEWPSSAAADMTPRAIRSLAAKTAVGRSAAGRSRRRSPAWKPPSSLVSHSSMSAVRPGGFHRRAVGATPEAKDHA